ncbi:hypothetical protein G647_03432 [Cladophialophora carrionii CBS 160.54]|uniref:Cytochrome P450 n=1 Tax=Cladophialophora carrionii CBS 160.54 TaxID=1279043 RepID=V9DCM6_9EURO|nr:uncharacterized protein G647_03432 [Cladophialophora carrionii CBS 160.54]ETI24063.1 hypothetical protein G647_03432 [Cladophialophora carrionii CBS 160.54]
MAISLPYPAPAVAAVVAFLVFRAIYRVTLHPLAKFPGPKLAAISSAYQAWYDLRPGTSYIFQFARLHEKFGPIVRITPNQLHVFDIAAYNEIFKIGTRYPRHRDNYNNEAADGFFNQLELKTAKPWRDAYQPYFSKGAITRLEPLIHSRIKKFLSKFESAASNNEPIDLSMGFRSVTSDVVTSYMFADNGFELLDVKGFQSSILIALEAYFDFTQWAMYWPNFMPWLTRQLQKLTKEQQEKVCSLQHCAQCRLKVERIMRNGGSVDGTPTVFDAWAKPSEKRTWTPSMRQMTADAFTFHGAGTDTTAHTLTTATWHLINNKGCLQKLRQELTEAIQEPESEQLVSTNVLETLPYLRAVVKEALRMSMGVPGRMARVVPEGGAVLCGQKIPGGTAITSVCYCYHFDPEVFPSPHTFDPDRWLSPDAPKLEARFMAFSKGPRSCIGINLAYAELYLNLAYMVRRFELEAFDTTDKDMEWKDNFVVSTKGHLRVKVRRVEEDD